MKMLFGLGLTSAFVSSAPADLIFLIPVSDNREKYKITRRERIDFLLRDETQPSDPRDVKISYKFTPLTTVEEISIGLRST